MFMVTLRQKSKQGTGNKMFMVTLSSLLLLSMMMFGTEGYEVGRPRRRSLVTVNLLPPEERKTPHFQEDFFRGLQEITSYSYSYSNAQKAIPKPCNQTTTPPWI